jgi:NAD(P)-dependent dehydrogenase (short-subunit alcohol dehydrogenase family)
LRYTRESIPSQAGRTVVVTGANGGLGLATALAFAAKDAHVVMAVRDQAKASHTVAAIRAEVPDASLELVALDLGSLVSVRRAAEEILAGHAVIDVLMNNAGVMAMPERQTADGFEMQLGVNHLGHWALTAQLMPALLAAPAARVVTTTSTAHHGGRALDPANPHLHGNYSPWRAYGQSKLANYHFGLGLNEQLERAGNRARSLIAHPGLAHTDLQKRTVREAGAGRTGSFWQSLAARTGMTPEQGAMPQLRAATDPAARGGQFYGPRFVNNGHAVPLPILRPGREAAVATLWAVSERETGIPMTV